MICAFFKIGIVQVKAVGMKDLLNTEWVHDILKKFGQAWEETLIALERGPEDYLSEGFYAECLGAVIRSFSPQRVEALLEDESFGHRRFGRPAATG